MLRVLVLAAFAAILAAPAWAADIYNGTVAGAPVVVLLRLNGPSAVEGRYAYRSQARSITLNGTVRGDHLALVETGIGGPDDAEPPVTGHWDLVRSGDSLSGTWRATASARPRPVTLTLLVRTPPDPTEEPQGFVDRNISIVGDSVGWAREDMPYLLEIARTPVRLGAEQVLGAGAWRLVSDPRSRASWPQLTRFADVQAMQRLNTVFEENRALAIRDTLECSESRFAQTGDRGSPEAPSVGVLYLGRRMITLDIAGSLYCGGAHPDNFTFQITYDIGEARPLDFNRVLRLDTEAEQTAFQTFWMARLRQRLRRDASFIPTECLHLDGEDASVPTVGYHATARGLAVAYSSSATVDAACAVTLTEIPLAELAPFLKAGADDYWR